MELLQRTAYIVSVSVQINIQLIRLACIAVDILVSFVEANKNTDYVPVLYIVLIVGAVIASYDVAVGKDFYYSVQYIFTAVPQV